MMLYFHSIIRKIYLHNTVAFKMSILLHQKRISYNAIGRWTWSLQTISTFDYTILTFYQTFSFTVEFRIRAIRNNTIRNSWTDLIIFTRGSFSLWMACCLASTFATGILSFWMTNLPQ
jgi:hypothetical protein